MKTVVRTMAWILAVLLGLPILCASLVMIVANNQAGREWIERTVSSSTGGEVSLKGLSGRFPDSLRVGHLGLSDKAGSWLSVDDAKLDWSPIKLFSGEAWIVRLDAARVILDRLPAAKEAASSGNSSLPVGIILDRLHIDRFELGEGAFGVAASIAIDGSARIASLGQGEIDLSLRRLDGEGAYSLRGKLDGGSVQARISAEEPSLGLISSLAGIREPDPLSLEATVYGPFSSMKSSMKLTLGPLRASVDGELDLIGERIAAMTVSASAPAMQPWPELSWQAMMLNAQVRGPFNKPSAGGALQVDKLKAADGFLEKVALDLQGDSGQLQVRGKLDGIKIPGPHPDLLKAAPVSIEGFVRMDAPNRPAAFELKHPLVSLKGKAVTAGDPNAEVFLALPDLQPLSAMAGLEERGSASATLRVSQRGEATSMDADGILAFVAATGPLSKLLGNSAKLGVALVIRGEDAAIDRFRLEGRALNLSVNGKIASKVAGLDWKIVLNDLSAVAETVSGQLAAEGRLAGPVDKFGVTSDISGEFAAKNLARSPIKLKLKLDGLPGEPSGQLTARGILAGATLMLDMAARQTAGGGLHLLVDRADWKSAHVSADLDLPKGALIPGGKLDLRMARLQDLQPLLNQPFVGSVSASLQTVSLGGRSAGRILLVANGAGMEGTASVERASVDIDVSEPLKNPALDGRARLEGIAVANQSGTLTLDVAGRLDALRLRWSAAVQDLGGADVLVNGLAGLDGKSKQAVVSELRADWKNESLRLLAPVKIAFGEGLSVDRLRLGLRDSTFEASGRISPTLDLNASLENFSGDLLGLVSTDLAVEGRLKADARLRGAPERPSGRIEVEAADVRLPSGPGRSLPPARLTANAELYGSTARLDSRLTVGPKADFRLSGTAPLDRSGSFDLQAAGSVDLKLLDAMLAAEGRRVRGQVSLNAAVSGHLSEPRVTGGLRLADGDVQDYALGAHLSDLTALLEADGGTVRVSRMEGNAGKGKIYAGGTIDLLGEGVPVDLTLTARNARPLASDRLTVNLNSDLTLRGRAKEKLTAAGRIHLNRADIRVPERMPASIAVLKVRRPDQPPPPPPTPPPDVLLDLAFDAPQAIFVRGRGLDAELGGKVSVRGTVANPQPVGGFELRRGQVSLVGKTLTFSKGKVGFDGGSLSDPSLDFVASSIGSNVTATLTIGGTASNPKITLSSVPTLPQDEILAQLLFSRSTTNLSPMEMVQIASALASLTGVTSGIGDPLESVRKNLGLDRLSVGGASPTLEAGRYIAPGVYLGAKQGIKGTGTQATVQIDVAKGLKLEGAVGTGSTSSAAQGSGAGTNSAGIIYQIEY